MLEKVRGPTNSRNINFINHLHVCSDYQRNTPENRVLVSLHIVVDLRTLDGLGVVSEVGWEPHRSSQ